jgi:hypothetical protein
MVVLETGKMDEIGAPAPPSWYHVQAPSFSKLSANILATIPCPSGLKCRRRRSR